MDNERKNLMLTEVIDLIINNIYTGFFVALIAIFIFPIFLFIINKIVGLSKAIRKKKVK